MASRKRQPKRIAKDRIRCRKCNKTKSLEEFPKHKGMPKGREYVCNACRRARHLEKSYGLSVDEYDAMLSAQGGKCQICGSSKPGGPWDRFYVDHCHTTGRVRGLLCIHCNRGLGSFRDNPVFLRSAIEYLFQL